MNKVSKKNQIIRGTAIGLGSILVLGAGAFAADTIIWGGEDNIAGLNTDASRLATVNGNLIAALTGARNDATNWAAQIATARAQLADTTTSDTTDQAKLNKAISDVSSLRSTGDTNASSQESTASTAISDYSATQASLQSDANAASSSVASQQSSSGQ